MPRQAVYAQLALPGTVDAPQVLARALDSPHGVDVARLHNAHSDGGRRRTSLDMTPAGGLAAEDAAPRLRRLPAPPAAMTPAPLLAPAMTGSTADLVGVTAAEEVGAAGLGLGLDAARVRGRH